MLTGKYDIQEKACTIRCLFSTSGLPASDLHAKQARTVHALYGREPSELLALSMNICRYSKSREQEQKAQVIIRCTNGNGAQVFWLLTTF